jgi:hypothetical protein
MAWQHLYDAITAVAQLIAIAIVTANRAHIRRLIRRQNAAEIRERLARSRG